jgi:hypothetical protein
MWMWGELGAEDLEDGRVYLRAYPYEGMVES